MAIQFNQHRTLFSTFDLVAEEWPPALARKRKESPKAFYECVLSPLCSAFRPAAEMLRIMAELMYYESSRPYYLVYPCVLDMIDKIPEDITLNKIDLPGVPDLSKTEWAAFSNEYAKISKKGAGTFSFLDQPPTSIQTIAIRFPEGSDYHSILACFVSYGKSQLIGLYCNVPSTIDKSFVMRDCCISIVDKDEQDSDTTLAELLKAARDYTKAKGHAETEKWARAIKTLACLGLLVEDGTGLLERDLLSRDEGKPITTEITDRASRLKGLGWTLGRALESIPHLRKPHWGIRHTGVGRKVPLLRPIKGSVVNRKKLTTIPTGLEGIA